MSEYNNRDEWDKRSLSMMLDEHLKEFNKKAQKLIEDEIYSNLNKDHFPTGEVPLVADSVLLSSMLYGNAKGVNKKVAAILNENFKAKRTIKDTAMRIYDGYNSNVDNLDVKKGLPKYLLEDRDAMRQIDKLTNKRLKETYKKVYEKLQSLDSKALDKAMWVALQEKSRYYANRIAQTEGARSRNLSRAVEYMEDDEVEYVKFEMSSAHKIVDICNYYASLDVGYGVGIVKKESMRVLPLHPHCHCRYTPYYKKIQKTNIKNPQKNTMNKFSKFEQKSIVGSRDKLREFQQGAKIEGLFNRVRPKYPITKYSDVFDAEKPKQDKKQFSIKDATGLSENELIEELKIKNPIDIVKGNALGEALVNWSEGSYTEVRKYYNDNKPSTTDTKTIEIANELDKLFKMKGDGIDVLYRGMNVYNRKDIEKFKSLKKGDIINDIAPSSWSSDYKVAEDFADIDNIDGQSIIFELTGVKEKSYKIDLVSTYRDEKELLLSPNVEKIIQSIETTIIDDEKIIKIKLKRV